MSFISLIILALALSMDAFSLALSIGLQKIKKDVIIKCAIIVGIYHFFMPLIGNYIGQYFFLVVNIKSDIILGSVLIIIAINAIIEKFSTDKAKFVNSILGYNIFAFSVSIDSFSVGFALENSKYIYYLIFALTSAIFTYLGFICGNAVNDLIGKIAEYIGIVILIGFAIICFM